MSNKLWEKNFEVNREIERFTVGNDREMDRYLAKYDVLGSMAHITMLAHIGLLEQRELTPLLAELKRIYALCEAGTFEIEDGVEDVHSQVELMLTRKLGDMGKKIHSGRSRNDQVLVDLKLFTRHELKEIVDQVKLLFDELIAKSNRYQTVLMPGYTHLQIAMPSSFGLWFGAYAESLTDDMLFLQAAYRLTNRNPLGSAAGYGSSFPLDRTMTTQLLGFDSMNYNVVYAQMGRGKTERNVAFYADHLFLTPKHVSKVILEVSGKTPTQWIDEYVVLEAKSLLKYSNLTIQEIADYLNFSTQSVFGKYFKHKTGLSPREYKES